MVRLCNKFVAFLNLCSLLLGLTAIAYAVHSGSACQKSILVPLLITGLLLITISLLGIVGSFWRDGSLIMAYMGVVFLLIVGFVIFAAFAQIASREDHSSGKYELRNNYSRWLTKHFVNDKNWNKIRSCLIDAQICHKFDRSSADMATNSYRKNLSPIELGCCMSPTDSCGVEHNNGTVAAPPEIGGGADMQGGSDDIDSDCFRWSNDEGRRCYYCESCKNGFLEEMKKEWRFVMIGGYCVVFLLIIMFCAACFAKINLNKPLEDGDEPKPPGCRSNSTPQTKQYPLKSKQIIRT